MTIIWCIISEIWSATEFFVTLSHFLPFNPIKIFWPFTPIKILKKWKKTHGDIIILHKCTKNHDHMLYCSWDTVRDRCNCYISGDIIILHTCTKNYDQMMYGSWDMVIDWRTDRWMGGRKKWHIEVGAPPTEG